MFHRRVKVTHSWSIQLSGLLCVFWLVGVGINKCPVSCFNKYLNSTRTFSLMLFFGDILRMWPFYLSPCIFFFISFVFSFSLTREQMYQWLWWSSDFSCGQHEVHICSSELNISTTFKCIAIKYGNAIHVPLRMNWNPSLNFFFVAFIRSKCQFVGLWLNSSKTDGIPISLSCLYPYMLN